ncbi:methyltransferase domain-containing protein [Streptomyces sp. NPDC058877]|uniref:methyltransferase domain-containing protein n=1 Tax=Streptomyces sp. NPDC058877 TaxID=3346665 RepID=UPI0036794D8C
MVAVTGFATMDAAYTAHSDGVRGRLRHGLVERRLLAELPTGSAGTLDVGCEDGEMTFRLASAGHDVTGVDPSTRMLAAAAARLAAGHGLMPLPRQGVRVFHDRLDDAWDRGGSR